VIGFKWCRIWLALPMSQQADATTAWNFYNTWNDVTSQRNDLQAADVAKVRHTTDVWVRMITEREAISGSKQAIIIAALSAVGTIFLFTGDVQLSALTFFNLMAIVTCELALFHLIGWKLGVVEAISITILVGLSVDFMLHLAESYAQSPLTSRKVNNHNNDNEHAYASTTHSFTHLRVLLVLTDRGILAQSN
jgi:hypothetical protein